MQKQLEQYFGCKVKIAEYKNKLQLPIFMTMRDIMMVEIWKRRMIQKLYHRKCLK